MVLKASILKFQNDSSQWLYYTFMKSFIELKVPKDIGYHKMKKNTNSHNALKHDMNTPDSMQQKQMLAAKKK